MTRSACTLSNFQPLGATPPVDSSRSYSRSCTPRGPGSTRQMPQSLVPFPELAFMPSPCTGSIAAAMNCVWTLRNFGSFVMPEDELKAKNSSPWHMRARAASTERPVGVTLALPKKNPRRATRALASGSAATNAPERGARERGGAVLGRAPNTCRGRLRSTSHDPRQAAPILSRQHPVCVIAAAKAQIKFQPQRQRVDLRGRIGCSDLAAKGGKARPRSAASARGAASP